MSSTNKTEKLGLNSWIGSDKPKRIDFNTDNEIIDRAISQHTEDTVVHINAEEREKYPQGIYAGGIDRCAGHSGDSCGVYDTGADTVHREKSGGIRPYRGAGGVC